MKVLILIPIPNCIPPDSVLLTMDILCQMREFHNIQKGIFKS